MINPKDNTRRNEYSLQQRIDQAIERNPLQAMVSIYRATSERNAREAIKQAHERALEPYQRVRFQCAIAIAETTRQILKEPRIIIEASREVCRKLPPFRRQIIEQSNGHLSIMQPRGLPNNEETRIRELSNVLDSAYRGNAEARRSLYLALEKIPQARIAMAKAINQTLLPHPKVHQAYVRALYQKTQKFFVKLKITYH